MICRFTLAVAMAAITLTGCAAHKKDEPASTSSITASAANLFKGPAEISAEDFSTGPTQVNVSHEISRTDDGSPVYVTVDGKDAGALIRGQSLQLHLPAGEHQVGGYVPTLLGFGRVTIPAVKVTTAPDKVKQVAYSTAKNKPAFTETDAKQG
ncbi:hypothetical protein ACMGGR_09760 [Erwinia sp. BNK-24-b]|uniref:hypothetical protein n=1 Tax=Erwinia TaxID=551 RepID=UPI001FED4EA2|nr:hypothetical protein [Erwinia phyllosphaerae]MBV4366793.1 hypothetical protein [Erwinia phyllosphaerae]